MVVTFKDAISMALCRGLKFVCLVMLYAPIWDYAMAQQLKFDLEPDGVSDEFVNYRLNFDDEILVQTLESPERIAAQLQFIMLERFRSEQASGVFDERAPKLILEVAVDSEEQELAVSEVIQIVARDAGGEFDRVGIFPFIIAEFARNYSPDTVHFSAADAELHRRRQAAKEIWQRTTNEIADRSGKTPSELDVTEFLIDRAVNKGDFPTEAVVVAVGLWLGERLIEKYNLQWIMIDDAWGKELVVASEANPHSFHIAPFSAVRKRLASAETSFAGHLDNRFVQMVREFGITAR